MTINNIYQVMDALAAKRRAFWSEADFQFEFAKELQRMYPAADIRLERPFPNGGTNRNYIDIVVTLDGEVYPIELKYKTKAASINDYNDEIIGLRNHSATDFGCYDYLKDVSRLEELCKQKNSKMGYAIMLTNDSAYYNKTDRVSSYDNFKIYDKAVRGAGVLDWTSTTFKCGERKKFQLLGCYAMQWHPYGDKTDGFKYLICEVK